MIKIIAIDDNPENLISLKVIINNAFPDSKVISASNGTEGIELSIAKDPDMIFLDITISGMDGFEVCRQLKQDQRLRDIPIVFLTSGKIGKEMRIKAFEVGVEGFLSTPIDETELIVQIRIMLKIKVANEQSRDEKARLKRLVTERNNELELNQIEMLNLLDKLKAENEAHKKTEKALIESEERFIHLFERAPLGYQSLDTDGHFIEVNEAWLMTLGYKREEVIGKWFGDFLVPEFVGSFRERFPLFKSLGKIHSEFEMLNRNGERKFISFDGRVGYKEDGSFEKTHCILQDITESKLTETEINRANRFYRFISQINQMVLRAPGQDRIITESCRIAIEYGEFRMAWIGLIDETQQLVKPVAWAGLEDGYLTKIVKISTNDLPEGHGMTGTAVREGKYYCCNDLTNDPNMAPWRDEALLRGYHSSIALPIIVQGIIVGAFSLYASEPNSFDGPNIRLLEEVTGNIGYALEMLENEKKRKLAEEAQRESMDLFQGLFNVSPDSIILIDPHDPSVSWPIVDCNKSACEMNGYTRDELVGKTIDVLNATLDSSEDRTLYFKNLQEKGTLYVETYHRHKDGHLFPVEVLTSIVTLGGREMVLGIDRDITERKLAEEMTREAEERFRMVFENVFDGIVIYEEYPDLAKRKLIDCNEQYAAMAGLTREELLKYESTNDIQISLEESSKDVRLESLSSRKAFRGSYSWIRPDGKDNIIEFIGVPVMLRGKLYSIGIDRDITYRKRAEEFLRESNELNNSLLKTIPFGMHIVDEQGNILFQSENLEQLFGHEAVGHKCWDLFPDKKEQCSDCPLFASIDVGKTELHETERFFGGKIFQISRTGMLFKGKNAILEIFQNITERKQAENEIRTLGKAIEQSPSSIVITNSNGKIEFVNNKFTVVTQYQSEEVKGRNPRIFNHGHIPVSEFMAFWETLQKGETWQGEILNRRKDRSYFWEDVAISALIDPDGSISNYILISDDITEKKQMLDDLIAAKEKAEESDRLKSAFLANMSHEIRTPLNSIIGFSELMTDPDYDSAQQFQFAQLINVSGNNLLSIISDIMDISKIESGQVQVKKRLFSVNQLIIDIQKVYSFKAIEKGIELKLDRSNPGEEVLIESDDNKLKQVLVNLVGNAIKFTEKGFISIAFSMTGDFVQFQVKDTGIGIPKEYHEQIFERFRQVETGNTRKYGGNGLGLAISKSLVELLGGEIWMESEQRKGTTFYFVIPSKGRRQS